MGNIDLERLSSAERKKLMKALKTQEEAEKKAKEDSVNDYKSMVSNTVEAVFPELVRVSENLADTKTGIRDKFKKIINVKGRLFGIKEAQQSHTFINEIGNKRITYGVYVNDSYDDTVQEGISLVKEYLVSLAKDAETKMLVETITKLLAKDQKGNLKASRVLQLQQLADKTGDKKFLEGMRIIRAAYKPVESKIFVRAEYKDKKNEWKNVPLGMSEV